MIDKQKIIFPTDDDELKLVLSKSADLYTKALLTTKPFYTKFLTPAQSAALFARFPKSELKLSLFGGYDDAERQVCSFHTFDDDIAYPITPLIFKIKSKNAKLSHRDFLGTILSLGIKRETIGDIVTRNDGAIVFCLSEIADYISSGISKIGGVGVSIQTCDDTANLEIKREFDTKSATVSSLRCDSVVAQALNLARSKAVELFERGLVVVNYEEAKSVSQPVKDGDVFSVRGHGKFKIQTDGHITKKGRIHISICKYK